MTWLTNLGSADRVYIIWIPNTQINYQNLIPQNKTVNEYSFLSTVSNNKECVTCAEIKGVDKVRDLQQILCWPSDQALITALQWNQILNCPITADDVHRAAAIFGPTVPILAGKMVRRCKQYNTTTNKEQVVVHPQILQHHKNLHLHTDFCFINWKPYITTITEKINYCMAKCTTGRRKQQILQHLKPLITKHNNTRFAIIELHADNEFKHIEMELNQ